jgi:hypothetical protein
MARDPLIGCGSARPCRRRSFKPGVCWSFSRVLAPGPPRVPHSAGRCRAGPQGASGLAATTFPELLVGPARSAAFLAEASMVWTDIDSVEQPGRTWGAGPEVTGQHLDGRRGAGGTPWGERIGTRPCHHPRGATRISMRTREGTRGVDERHRRGVDRGDQTSVTDRRRPRRHPDLREPLRAGRRPIRSTPRPDPASPIGRANLWGHDPGGTALASSCKERQPGKPKGFTLLTCRSRLYGDSGPSKLSA